MSENPTPLPDEVIEQMLAGEMLKCLFTFDPDHAAPMLEQFMGWVEGGFMTMEQAAAVIHQITNGERTDD